MVFILSPSFCKERSSFGGCSNEEDGEDAEEGVALMVSAEQDALYTGIQGFVGNGWNGSDLYPDPCGWTPIQFGPVDGVLFADYGTDLGSGSSVPGDPPGARFKPGNEYGYGFGIRVDSPLGPLRLEYAFNNKNHRRFHFGVDQRN